MPGLRSALAAAVAAALLALVLATSAAANVHQFRYGVVEGSTLQPLLDVPAMGSANVEALRVPMDWGVAEDVRGQGDRCNAVYDWSRYDNIVSQASREDIRVAPFIVGSPRYVGSIRTGAPSTRSPAIEDYKCFVRALVDRYGRGGDYLSIDQSALAITEWQVWNEVNLSDYAAKGKPDPKEYARLLKLSRRIILDVDSRAQIILAGMPEITGRGFYVHKYLRKLYRVRGIEREFDAVGLHPYARNWRGVEGALTRLRDTLREVGDRRRTVWITEFGWSDLGPRDAFQVKGPKGQATQLEKAIQMMRRERGRYNLGSIFYFRWRDVADRGDNGERFDYAGLYRKNGSAKRACHSFVRFTKGSCPRIGGGASAASRTDPVLESPGAAAEIKPSPPE